MKNIILLGAGGHCKVIIDLIEELNQYNIIGIYDDYHNDSLYDIKILGRINEVNKYINNKDIYFVIGIGSNLIRKKIYEEFIDLNWCSLIHPNAIVSKKSKIDIGTVICAGSVIQTEVIIGKHCIINTNCNIDHETIIQDFSDICPGVTICGQVNIGYNTFIGANSTIIQGLKIGNYNIIGAGSVIIKNIDDNKKIVGNPGKYI